MTLSPQTRLKNAERELANAERQFAIAQEGRQRLSEVLEQHQAEQAAALQDWNRDKSEANVSRMTTARSQLNAVRELLQEDVLPYARAEAELERCQEQLTTVKCVTEVIHLAEGLQRQQDYFATDALELQRTITELLDRMRKTADGWDAMHQKQFQLAQEAGLSPVQLQRRVEAWGFDANPLKRVLVRSPLDGNDTLAFRTTYNWPDAVDGSDLAQYAKRIAQQGILDHYNAKSRPARSSYTPRPTLTAYQEEQAEERELARLAAVQHKASQQAELEADALEAQQEREFGAKPIFHGGQVISHIPAATAGDDDECKQAKTAPKTGEGFGVTDHPPHLARIEWNDRQRLERIRILLVECTDNALEHVKGLTSSEDELKRNKGTQLLAVLSPSAVKVYQLGEYEARLETLEQAVAAMKGDK